MIRLSALMFTLVSCLLSGVQCMAESVNVIIVGGSSGMGKAAALEVIRGGGKVLLVSRSDEKLSSARSYLQEQVPDALVECAVLDATDETQVEGFASILHTDTWDCLVLTAAGRAAHGPVQELETQATRDMLETKLWTAYYCSKYISKKLREGGAIVFTAGILNRRPGLNCAPLAMANGALEGLTRTLALELGPRLRVNCLSPGFCDTERFDHLTAERKSQMMANTAASLPLQTVGQPKDMGQALFYLMTAKFCTGVILDVDGGHGIRQYAQVSTDPMRQGPDSK